MKLTGFETAAQTTRTDARSGSPGEVDRLRNNLRRVAEPVLGFGVSPVLGVGICVGFSAALGEPA